jgi:hypothetical protein
MNSLTIVTSITHTYIHTYHSRFILQGVTETTQIFLPDTHILLKWLSYKKYLAKDVHVVSPPPPDRSYLKYEYNTHKKYFSKVKYACQRVSGVLVVWATPS